jgi:hypothetical protein
MNYIQVNITACIEVPKEHLEFYEASSIEEAVKNQQQWYKDGSIGLVELIEDCVTEVTFTAIKDAP